MEEQKSNRVRKQRLRPLGYRPPSKFQRFLQRIAAVFRKHRERIPFVLSGLLLIAVLTIACVVFFFSNSTAQDKARAALENNERFTTETQAKVEQGNSAALAMEEFLTTPNLQRRIDLAVKLPSNLQPHTFGPPPLREPQLDYRKVGNPVLLKKAGTPLYLQEIAVQTHRLPLILIERNGQWEIDYEAFTGQNQSPWSKLRSSKALEVEVRVSLSRGATQGPGFEEAKTWLSYKLENPNWPLSLEGFVRKGSETARHLAQIRDGANVFGNKVILLLRREKSHRERQFEIIQVVEKGWTKFPS